MRRSSLDNIDNKTHGADDVLYCVLILNFNCATFTLKAVESVIRNGVDKNKYIVQIVDNNSNEKDRQMLRTIQSHQVSIVELQQNRGFAVGYNAAAQAACERWSPEYLVIMNPDIEITKFGTIERLIRTIQSGGKKIVGAQPLIFNYRHPGKSTTQISLRKVPNYWDLVVTESIFLRYLFRSRFRNYTMLDNIPYERVISFYVPSGAFFVIKTEAFYDLGGFDENTFLYGEEIILGKKLQDRSKMLLLEPTIEVLHYQGATTGFERWVPRRQMYKHRLKSNLYYVRKYLGVSRLSECGLRIVSEIGYIIRIIAWLIYSPLVMLKKRVRIITNKNTK